MLNDLFFFPQDHTGLHWYDLAGYRNVCSRCSSQLEVTASKSRVNTKLFLLETPLLLNFHVHFILQNKVLDQRVGPRDLLQDLRSWTFGNNPLSQPVSVSLNSMGFLIQNIFSYVLFYFIFYFLKNRENKPRKGGICVANHTSPIDIVILCNDAGYAMVGIFFSFLLLVLQSDFLWWKLLHSDIIITNILLPGGSGSWRTDGSPAEGHGEGLPSYLVRESRDERSPPSD